MSLVSGWDKIKPEGMTDSEMVIEVEYSNKMDFFTDRVAYFKIPKKLLKKIEEATDLDEGAEDEKHFLKQFPQAEYLYSICDNLNTPGIGEGYMERALEAVVQGHLYTFYSADDTVSDAPSCVYCDGKPTELDAKTFRDRILQDFYEGKCEEPFMSLGIDFYYKRFFEKPNRKKRRKKLKKKNYKVPCVWTMMGYLKVKAATPKEAWKAAEKEGVNCPLPDNGEYLEDSFHLDYEGTPLEID